MHADRSIKFCLVCITLFLGLIALRPIVGPGSVRAQKQYEYQVVRVYSDGPQDPPAVVSKHTKEGWEPVAMSFYVDRDTRGWVLFRR